jgi:UDP-N-acetylmuramoyl-tripeptide--D-alanyl-D-alanine ligase
MDIETLYQIFLRSAKVVTDSRAIEPGCIFFALRGEHFDGNKFAAEAIKKGAAYSVVDDPQLPPHEYFIQCKSVLDTLQDLARHHRRKFKIPVLAITGSNGKTTTKELVSAVLQSQYKVHFTRGNLNNHIGVPLTLLSLPKDTEIAVIEMGANHQGEIDFLTGIAAPTHGLITNIGEAHLEGFGGLEGVKKGKSELYKYLGAKGGTIFLCTDEPYLSELAGNSGSIVQYGEKKPNKGSDKIFIRIVRESNQPFVSVSFGDGHEAKIQVNSRLTGAYNFPNIAAAIAVGKYFNVPGIQIKNAIESYVPSMMRSQIIQKGANKIILDAYNANPTSMREAIMNLRHLNAESKIAILGDMLELGPYSKTAHEHIAQLALAQDFDLTVLVGGQFQSVNINGKVLFFENVETAGAWFKTQEFSGATILVKGSRSMHMEKLLNF